MVELAQSQEATLVRLGAEARIVLGPPEPRDGGEKDAVMVNVDQKESPP